ncbi:hypothetical protein ACGFIF_17115 [Kribbella sp. NPDC049174]|uniref:hypothetical protein n=1 Tax=Kribbella sp. NPDC049174 TaxID=3364112 RepID=UPI0037204830
MLSAFWEGVNGKFADRWAAVAGPALAYWLGGLLTWAYHGGGLYRLSELTTWLDRQSTVAQLAVLLCVLVGVLASGVIVDRLTFPALRLLEGYWPGWLSGVRGWLIRRRQDRSKAENAEWQQLAAVVMGQPEIATPEQLAAFVRLDSERRRQPSNPNRYLPTRIGNILRAAESLPGDKYGLDAVVVWPRLWLLLPDTPRKEVQAARASLDAGVAATIWGLLLCAFTVWTPLVIPVGLTIAVAAAWFWIPARAKIFGDLLEAAFDLHRTELYRQLRWPLPTDPRQERIQGERLTSYLWRGSDDAEPPFTPS